MISKELLKKYNDPKNFINRDLSWVEFNRRVLEEALNPELPLLEKIKFISIFHSNLDEFYMIRIAGLKEQVAANVLEPTIDGLTPIEQLRKTEQKLKPMLDQAMDLWKNQIVPNLPENGVEIAEYFQLSENEKEVLTNYFKKEIFPILTPLAFDPGRPFPYISNLSLNFAIFVNRPNGENHFARLKIPNTLPRLLQIDKILEPNKKIQTNGQFSAKYVWIGDLIKDNLNLLFPGMENLEVTRDDVHVIDGPLALSDLIQLYDLPLHQLKSKPFYPVLPKTFEDETDFFSLIKQKDILLHHPYHSFSPVIDFIKQASNDPDVLAIKQTLYRVGSSSPIIKYLIEAAERGKQVAVLVELKARFDEENNIFWARELEKVGVHVVYGLVGLKTHAKMTLVVRRESDGVHKYVHLSTGNYNITTAKIYTALGLFTSDEEISSDVTEIFNYLTGYSKQTEFRKLIVAPINMREKILSLILREIENVKSGGTGKLIFKMNALVDPVLISAHYEASQNGVEIGLIVRGICCLVPGVPGLSENIKVRSIVGRFLEHSRVFYFFNNGEEDIYLSSADLMQRNLDRRVEITFPIKDAVLKNELLKNVLRSALKDNLKARILKPDLTYELLKPANEEKKIDSQEWLMSHTIKAHTKAVKNKF